MPRSSAGTAAAAVTSAGAERAPPIPWDRILSRLGQALAGESLPSVSQAAAHRPDPFRVLVSTVISLRTKDEVTSVASERLLTRAPTPEAMAGLAEGEIARLIFPAGFYNTKARQLKTMAGILVRQHGSRVPSSMEALLELPGVGRKTANLVRNLGYGLEGICVDTHVHRISNRFGWVSTGSPAETETALELILPRRYWIPINPLLVAFGQRICTPVSPRCSLCPVGEHCRRVGVQRSR